MNNIQEQNKHYFSQRGLQDLKSDVELVFAIGAEIKLLKKGKRFFGRCPICESQKYSLEHVCEAAIGSVQPDDYKECLPLPLSHSSPAAFSKLHSENSEQEFSLVISPKLNLWYCYGECKKGASIIDWVMFSEKLKLVEALAVLAERYPFLAQKGQLGKRGLNEAMPDEKNFPSYQPPLQKIIDHYHACFYKIPVTEGLQSKAIRYLRSIGISHKALKRYKIGFCDSSLVRGFLERVTNNLNALVDEEIQYLEMLPSTQEMNAPVREYFDGQIVFPVLDQQGQCLQLFSRKIPEKIKIAQIGLVTSSGLTRSA